MVCEPRPGKPVTQYSYAWAGLQLGLSARTIASMVKRGTIGYVRCGRFVRIYANHIAAYKRANEHKPKRGRKANGATY